MFSKSRCFDVSHLFSSSCYSYVYLAGFRVNSMGSAPGGSGRNFVFRTKSGSVLDAMQPPVQLLTNWSLVTKTTYFIRLLINQE